MNKFISIILISGVLTILSISSVMAITCCSTATNCTSYGDNPAANCTNGTFTDRCCNNSQDAHLGPWCSINGPFGGYNHDCQDSPPSVENTPTPTVCLRPGNVTSFSGFCNSFGTNVSLQWGTADRATHYNLRVDDISNGWSGTCSLVNTGDTCLDNLTGNTYSFNSTSGHSYHWWVDAANSCGGTGADGGTVQCLAPTPTTGAPTATSTPIPTATRAPTPTPTSPVISLVCNSISGPTSLLKGTTAQLTSLRSYNGTMALSYSWTSNCGGTFTNNNPPGITFQAPTSSGSTCTIFLTIADTAGLSSTCPTYTINITDTAGISGYVVEEGVNNCTYDAFDTGINSKNIELWELNAKIAEFTTISDVNNKKGFYTFNSLLPGHSYTVKYRPASGEQSSCPSGSPQSIVIANLPSSGASNQNFYLYKAVSSVSSWFQTVDGDVHSNSDIQTNIPSNSYQFATFLVTSINDSLFRVSLPSGDKKAWDDLASSRKWYAFPYPPALSNPLQYFELGSNTPFYSFFTTKFKPDLSPLLADILPPIDNLTINKIVPINPPSNTVVINSPITLPNAQPSSIIYYIKGNVNIDSDNAIQTGRDSVAIFVISGNLLIKSTVTKLEGVYFVDGTINPSYDTPSSLQLIVKGMMYASSSRGFMFEKNKRSLGASNSNTPALKFIYQPKYLLNTRLLELFGKKDSKWQEIPG